MSDPHAEQVVRDFFAAMQGDYEAHVGAYEKYLDDDVTFTNTGLPTANNKAEVLAMVKQSYEAAGFDRLTSTFVEVASSEGTVLVLRQEQAWAGNDLLIDYPIMGTFKVVDGRITLWRDFFDTGPVLKAYGFV